MKLISKQMLCLNDNAIKICEIISIAEKIIKEVLWKSREGYVEFFLEDSFLP